MSDHSRQWNKIVTGSVALVLANLTFLAFIDKSLDHFLVSLGVVVAGVLGQRFLFHDNLFGRFDELYRFSTRDTGRIFGFKVRERRLRLGMLDKVGGSFFILKILFVFGCIYLLNKNYFSSHSREIFVLVAFLLAWWEELFWIPVIVSILAVVFLSFSTWGGVSWHLVLVYCVMVAEVFYFNWFIQTNVSKVRSSPADRELAVKALKPAWIESSFTYLIMASALFLIIPKCDYTPELKKKRKYAKVGNQSRSSSEGSGRQKSKMGATARQDKKAKGHSPAPSGRGSERDPAKRKIRTKLAKGQKVKNPGGNGEDQQFEEEQASKRDGKNLETQPIVGKGKAGDIEFSQQKQKSGSGDKAGQSKGQGTNGGTAESAGELKNEAGKTAAAANKKPPPPKKDDKKELKFFLGLLVVGLLGYVLFSKKKPVKALKNKIREKRQRKIFVKQSRHQLGMEIQKILENCQHEDFNRLVIEIYHVLSKFFDNIGLSRPIHFTPDQYYWMIYSLKPRCRQPFSYVTSLFQGVLYGKKQATKYEFNQLLNAVNAIQSKV